MTLYTLGEHPDNERLSPPFGISVRKWTALERLVLSAERCSAVSVAYSFFRKC